MEEAFLKNLYKEVEARTGWGDSRLWPHKRYVELSDQIYNSTNVLISPSTLKRLLGKVKTSERYSPHFDTKDSLARFCGYANWDEFRKEHRKGAEHADIGWEEMTKSSPDQTTQSIAKSKSLKPLIMYTAALFVLSLLSLLIFYVYRPAPPCDVSIECLNPVGFAPHTAIFRYNMSKCNGNNVKLSFSKKYKTLLKSSSNTVTAYFKLPGLVKTILEKDDAVQQADKIFIKSRGWVNFAFQDLKISEVLDEIPPNIDTHSFYFFNKFNFSAQELDGTGIQQKKIFWTSHRWFDDFKVDGDNFTLKTELKNDSYINNAQCGHVLLDLYFENGRMKIHLVKPGCSHWVQVILSEKRWKGTESNMEVFGQDNTTFKELEVLNQKKKVIIKIKDDVLLEEAYEKSLGQLKGIVFTFLGKGQVKYLDIDGRVTWAAD